MRENDIDESFVRYSPEEYHNFPESSAAGEQESQNLESSALWAEFEGTADTGDDLFNNDVQQPRASENQRPDHGHSTLTSRRKALGGELGNYRIVVYNSLLHREPETLVKAMIVASADKSFIESIPDNTFAEIIALIQPKTFLRGVSNIHLDISPGLAGIMNVTPIDILVKDYLRIMARILSERREAEKNLNITDYQVLLSIADWCGSKTLASRLWRLMTEMDHIRPNVVCYNHYLAAVINNERHNASTRHQQRITPFTTAARSKSKLGGPFVAYGFGESGIKQTIISKHREMVKQGIIPNEMTHRIMIWGVACEGDIEMVKGILKRVWSIDVDDLMNDTAESYVQVDMRRDSPLYPTGELLHAVAHAFSINNDIPAALRVVDRISRVYDIPIPFRVWQKLFQFAFVLSVPRPVSDRIGQLPKQGLLRLWDTMTSEPYNVRPTLAMYDQLIKGLFYMQRLPEMWTYIQEAREKAEAPRRRAERAKARHELAIQRSTSNWSPNASIEKLERRVRYQNLLLKRIYFWQQRWFRLLLASMRSWQKVDRDQHWSIVEMPNIILEMQQFEYKENIFYDVPGGQVSLAMRKRRLMKN